MRPPHFCGGNLSAWQTSACQRGRFNEAPAFLRGKPCISPLGSSSPSRFNEAPAFLRGKLDEKMVVKGTVVSFNEAPAFLRGKPQKAGRASLIPNPELQ